MYIPILFIFIFAIILLFFGAWLLKRYGAFKEVPVKPSAISNIGSNVDDFKIPSLWGDLTPSIYSADGTCETAGNSCSSFIFKPTNYAPPSTNINEAGKCLEGTGNCFRLENDYVGCLFQDEIQGQYAKHTCINKADTQSGLGCRSSVTGDSVPLGQSECIWTSCGTALSNCKDRSLNFVILNYDPTFLVAPGKDWSTNPLTVLKCLTHEYTNETIPISNIILQNCNIQNSGFNINDCANPSCYSDLWVFEFYTFDANDVLTQSNTGPLCSIMDRSTGKFLAPEGFSPGRFYQPKENTLLTLISDTSNFPGVWWYNFPGFFPFGCPGDNAVIDCTAPPQIVFTSGWQFYLQAQVDQNNFQNYFAGLTSINFKPNANNPNPEYPPCPVDPSKEYEDCPGSDPWSVELNSFQINDRGYPQPSSTQYTWKVNTTQSFRSTLPVTLMSTKILDYGLYTNTILSNSYFNSKLSS